MDDWPAMTMMDQTAAPARQPAVGAPVERGVRRLCTRLQRPSWRVQRAMWRVTRDKWIPGADVMRIGLQLSQCASGAPHTVFKAAVANECCVVGMIRGKPPAFVWESHYRSVLAAVRANEKRGSAFVELALLRTAEGQKMGFVYENNW